MKAESRSVLRTKKKIQEGFIELLKKKNINEISVTELTNLIDINRGTFYTHYKDIYDLLEELENDLFRQVDEIFSANVSCPIPGILQTVFNMLEENRDFCKILLGNQGDLTFMLRMKEFVEKELFHIWDSLGLTTRPEQEKEDYALFSAYVINGCVGVMQKWLETDSQKSIEEMISFTSNVLRASFVAFTGIAADVLPMK